MEAAYMNKRLNEAIKKLEEIKEETLNVSENINNGEITKKGKRAVAMQQLTEKFIVINKTYQDIKYNSLTRELYIEFLNDTWNMIKNIPEIK